jgi:hypothetical protein
VPGANGLCGVQGLEATHRAVAVLKMLMVAFDRLLDG